MRLMEDVGAPLAVTAIDLVTETMAPQWNSWAAYGVAAFGYAGEMFRYGNQFTKNMGIAAFPWAAKALYDTIRGGMSRPAPIKRMARVAVRREFPSTLS